MTTIRKAFADAATYLATGLLIRLFWLFESTLDIRAWGTEHVRLCKRAGERPLLVLWHGKSFLPITYFHGEHLCVYASRDRTPEAYDRMQLQFRWLTLRMIERLGYEVLDASEFASESRGVLRFVQTLRSGGGAIAADGPGGPIYKAKPGPCFLAKKCGVTLLPIGAAILSGSRLDQWDHFEIPHLFSRATIVVEPPIWVPEQADEEDLERKRLELEDALNRASRMAEERVGLRTATVAEAETPPPLKAQPAPPQ